MGLVDVVVDHVLVVVDRSGGVDELSCVLARTRLDGALTNDEIKLICLGARRSRISQIKVTGNPLAAGPAPCTMEVSEWKPSQSGRVILKAHILLVKLIIDLQNSGR